MECSKQFCNEKCTQGKESKNQILLHCKCGEDIQTFIWKWSSMNSSPNTEISNENKDIIFHPSYSSGTAAVRGDSSFKPNVHYYWEIEITSSMYGTDVMVGVGTSKVVFADWRFRFCSLLGIDSQSWGYSYRGLVQHNNKTRKYGSQFGLGSIIGVYLDMCKGTLEYYLNRKPLGVAFSGIKGYTLYPMVSSTAAQSTIKLICAVSEETTLQMLCLQFISKNKTLHQYYREIPGLKKLYDTQYFWIVPDYNDNVSSFTEEQNSMNYKNNKKKQKQFQEMKAIS